MKKIFLSLILSFSILSLVSCEDDDTTKIDEIQNPLIGKWVVTQVGHLEPLGDENFVTYEEYINDCGDNTILFTENDFNLESFYLDGGNCMNSTIDGNYTFNVNTIVLTYTEDVNGEIVEMRQSLTILKLTNNTLEVSYTNEVSGETEFNILIKE